MTTATMRYPLARVNYGRDEIAAVTACLEAGRTTMGPCVEQFEHDFASYVGARYAVMVNSGSSADLLVAQSLSGFLGATGEEGAEILVPAVTWPTQVWSCVQAGYTVRLVDVDPATLQWNPEDTEANVTHKTRAFFPAHILGNVGRLDRAIQMACATFGGRLGPLILEDCCEALGARWENRHVGTFGIASAFSFFFSHLLTTMEGGMVVTNDDALAHDLRLWRSHGWEQKTDKPFHFSTWGMNLRPTEVQGAFGLVQLARLDDFIEARRRNFARLLAAIAPWHDVLRTVTWSPAVTPSWHAFPLLLTPEASFSKRELCTFLTAQGIENRPIVAGNLARQPGIAAHPRIVFGALPGADAIHKRGFYIGLSSQDDEEGTAYVGEVLDTFLRQHV